MNREQVVALMSGSKTEAEWNSNCAKVKEACGGDYPSFWYEAIVMAGVVEQTAAKWGGDAGIHISAYKR
jgi:hypothetical protein